MQSKSTKLDNNKNVTIDNNQNTKQQQNKTNGAGMMLLGYVCCLLFVRVGCDVTIRCKLAIKDIDKD